MSLPQQAVYVFGTFTGKNEGAPTDPTRPDPILTPLPIRVQTTDASRIAISVTYQLDFPLTVTLQTLTGTLIYQIGGQATDDVVLKPIPDLILQSTGWTIKQMTIEASGRCTVVLSVYPAEA